MCQYDFISCHLFIHMRECLCSMHMHMCEFHRGQRGSSGILCHYPPYSFKVVSPAGIGAYFIFPSDNSQQGSRIF